MTIIGIGYIIAGEVISGKIEKGQIIYLNAYFACRIDAIETIEYSEPNASETALIIEPLEDNLSAELKLLVPGQIIHILS